MENKSSTQDDIDDSDFEKVEATATTITSTNNPNDMESSGILVEKPQSQEPSSRSVAPNRRRIIKATAPPPSSASTSVTASISSAESGDDSSEHHSSSHQNTTIISKSNDEALLKESIEQGRAKRMQRLAADQKTKREKQQKQRREKPQLIEAKANPFSKFLSAFSVEAKFPSHKRAHSSVEESEQPPPKLPRVNLGVLATVPIIPGPSNIMFSKGPMSCTALSLPLRSTRPAAFNPAPTNPPIISSKAFNYSIGSKPDSLFNL